MSDLRAMRRVLALTVGVSLATGVSLANAQKVYWTDIETDKIQRADLDGSNVEDVIASFLRSPGAIALERDDPASIRWTCTGRVSAVEEAISTS